MKKLVLSESEVYQVLLKHAAKELGFDVSDEKLRGGVEFDIDAISRRINSVELSVWVKD